MWTQIIDTCFYLAVKMLTDCWYQSCYPVDIMMVVAVLPTEKSEQAQSRRQLLCRLHLRLQVFTEGSNNVCFPLSVSLLHLLISPCCRTKGHLSLSVRLAYSLSSSVYLFLSHLLPDEMHTCSKGRIERHEEVNRCWDRWVVGERCWRNSKTDRDVFFNKYDHK